MLAESQDRVHKERSMRRRRLRKYLDALQAITGRKRPMQRDALHQAIGAAKKDAGRDARLVQIAVTHCGKGQRQTATLTWRLDRAKLREAWRREGRCLLRTNLTDTDPTKLWAFYLQLTEVEQAFNLKAGIETTDDADGTDMQGLATNGALTRRVKVFSRTRQPNLLHPCHLCHPW